MLKQLQECNNIHKALQKLKCCCPLHDTTQEKDDFEIPEFEHKILCTSFAESSFLPSWAALLLLTIRSVCVLERMRVLSFYQD